MIITGGMLGTAGIAVSIGTVVACGSSPVEYRILANVKAEWNLGSDYVPYWSNYQKGKAVATTLSADTRAGDTATTTFQYLPEKTATASNTPFQVTYEWTVLPSLSDWRMPTVDHQTDSRQRFYSIGYDSQQPSADSGSALANFVSVHDGDTFSLAAQRETQLAGPIQVLKKALVDQQLVDANYDYALKTASTRLIGADTPEITDNNDFKPTVGVEYLWAKRATDFVRAQMTYGQRDDSDNTPFKTYLTVTGKGAYDRVMANVKYLPFDLVGTTDVAAADKQAAWNDLAADLVRYGLARVAYVEASFMSANAIMPGVNALNTDYFDYLLELQQNAVNNRVGLWGTAKEQWWSNGNSTKLWNPGNDVFPKDSRLTTSHGLS